MDKKIIKKNSVKSSYRLKNQMLQPLGALLEITSSCNYKCKHCYNRTPSNLLQDDFSDAEWLDFLQELLSYDLMQITLSGGEPFVKKDLLCNMIEVIAKYPYVKICINTNGSLVDKEFIRYYSSLKNPKSIQVSIDGALASDHDQVRGIKNAWNKAVETCCLITATDIDLFIAHTVNSININSIEKIFDLAMILGVKALNIGAAFPLGEALNDENSGIILSYEGRCHANEIINSIKDEYSSFFTTNQTSPGGSDYLNKFRDSYPDWLLVTSNGDVKLECRLPYIVGNVRNDNIMNLWNKVNIHSKSERISKIISEHIELNKDINNFKKIYLE